MRSFNEWAKEKTDLFEMANFFNKEMGGGDQWSLQNLEVEGPSIYDVLKGKKGGLSIEDLSTALIEKSKFRRKGSDDAFTSLADLAKAKGMDPAVVKRGYINALKTQLRSQKAKGWKERVAVLPGNKWALTPKAKDPMAKGGRQKEQSSLLDFGDESKESKGKEEK